MLNIVTEPAPGWVLRWMSEELCKVLPNSKVTEQMDPNADANIYINYGLLHEKSKLDIALFTHFEYKNVDLIQKWYDASAKADLCLAMNKNILKYLDKSKSVVVYIPPAKSFYKEKLILGVVGRNYSYTNRKRFDLIERLKEVNGVEIKRAESLSFEEMPKFYKEIDYLLIIAENEGGPMPLVEALAYGKPVITRDVGFAYYYPVILYKEDDELVDIIRRLRLEGVTWERIGCEITSFVNKE